MRSSTARIGCLVLMGPSRNVSVDAARFRRRTPLKEPEARPLTVHFTEGQL